MPRRFPDAICGPCGAKYGRGDTNPYATWHEGTCDLCGSEAPLTEPRDFGHLKPNWREILMGKEPG